MINDGNPVFDTPGGEATIDNVFCLSLSEVMTKEYGFHKNTFTYGESGFLTDNCYTDSDTTRVVMLTDYVKNQASYLYGDSAGNDCWWLRSTGLNDELASCVDSEGGVDAMGLEATTDYAMLRPAIRINLKNNPGLWKYAGIVCSDGTKNEIERDKIAVTGISVSPTLNIREGEKSYLFPEFTPSNATHPRIRWTSKNPGIASVNKNGLVEGLKVGTTDITVEIIDSNLSGMCLVTVGKPEFTGVNKPLISEDGQVSWDCILFGNLSQKDTNDDGYCFEKDTEVKAVPDKVRYFSENGKLPLNFTGGEGEYSADEKQPIKWRVLDIDKDGNAFLLSDKLLDTIYRYKYYDYGTPLERPGYSLWETSVVRSYLNGYGAELNNGRIDYSSDGFIIQAFSKSERDAITKSKVDNKDNIGVIGKRES